MNPQIARLYWLIALLFAILVGFTSYWSIFAAGDLKQRSENKRPLLEQQRVRRGTITAADGTVLAVSRALGRGGSRRYVRRYPLGSLFAHAVGYNFIDRGRTGIELSHNDDLVGSRAEFVSILDQLRGRRQAGDELRMTLDPAAQRAAVAGLAGRTGSIVAIEPATGRVRVMANQPSFDPNRVSRDFGRLARTPGSPLLNRATQAQGYAPGSTFKVVTASAAIDSGRFTPSSVFSGKSPITVSGQPFANFANTQYGRIDLTTALTHSVNTVWAQVALQLGPETMYRYMDRFGLNARPPLDYPAGELALSGVFRGDRLLTAGDRPDIGRVGIGQEQGLTVTPLQMAMVASAVANGGLLMRPRLWDRVIDRDGRIVARLNPDPYRRVMSPESAGQVAEMMTNVVREGTGTAAALEGVDVAGKTGTAGRPGTGLSQVWFIGFAPASRPRVAVAVTIERSPGTGGEVAAPIAKQVMQSLLRR